MAGKLPAPGSAKCQGGGGGPPPAGPACSCVHAVACAACHPTGTGGQTYYPGTSVELVSCEGAATHMQWLRLEVLGGGTKGAVMLMSDGLCLSLPAAGNGDAGSPGGTGHTAALSQPPPPPQQQLVRPSNADHAPGGHPPAPLAEVRVTVTATNGVGTAIINEVRLYDDDGRAPFPRRP